MLLLKLRLTSQRALREIFVLSRIDENIQYKLNGLCFYRIPTSFYQPVASFVLNKGHYCQMIYFCLLLMCQFFSGLDDPSATRRL